MWFDGRFMCDTPLIMTMLMSTAVLCGFTCRGVSGDRRQPQLFLVPTYRHLVCSSGAVLSIPAHIWRWAWWAFLDSLLQPPQRGRRWRPAAWWWAHTSLKAVPTVSPALHPAEWGPISQLPSCSRPTAHCVHTATLVFPSGPAHHPLLGGSVPLLVTLQNKVAAVAPGITPVFLRQDESETCLGLHAQGPRSTLGVGWGWSHGQAVCLLSWPPPTSLTSDISGADSLTSMGTCQPPALGTPAPWAGMGLGQEHLHLIHETLRALPTAGVSAAPLLT